MPLWCCPCPRAAFNGNAQSGKRPLRFAPAAAGQNEARLKERLLAALTGADAAAAAARLCALGWRDDPPVRAALERQGLLSEPEAVKRFSGEEAQRILTNLRDAEGKSLVRPPEAVDEF